MAEDGERDRHLSELANLLERSSMDEAAARIQAVLRGRQARVEYKVRVTEQRAATTVQKHVRGWTTRARTDDERRRRREEEEAQRRREEEEAQRRRKEEEAQRRRKEEEAQRRREEEEAQRRRKEEEAQRRTLEVGAALSIQRMVRTQSMRRREEEELRRREAESADKARNSELERERLQRAPDEVAGGALSHAEESALLERERRRLEEAMAARGAARVVMMARMRAINISSAAAPAGAVDESLPETPQRRVLFRVGDSPEDGPGASSASVASASTRTSVNEDDYPNPDEDMDPFTRQMRDRTATAGPSLDLPGTDRPSIGLGFEILDHGTGLPVDRTSISPVKINLTMISMA
jgi:hypothetical protein